MLLAILLAVSPSSTDAVARVGARTIASAEVAARIAALRRAGQTGEAKAALETLIDEALLAQDDAASGLESAPEVRAARESERRRLAAQAMTEKEIAAGVRVTEQQLLAAYHASADGARLELITLPSREAAQAVLQRIRAGGSFVVEAQHSMDVGSALHGGDIGLRSRAELDPALREPAFSAPLNELQGPVQLVIGWGVFRVRERTIADAAGFEDRKPELRHYLEQTLRKQAVAHVVARLRERYQVKLDEAFLASTGSSLKATPQQTGRAVARIAGQPVRYADVLGRLQKLTGSGAGGHLTGPSVKTAFAWELIDDLLLERAAISRGFGDDPAVVAGARAAAEQAMARLAADRIRKTAPAPDEARISGYYETHKDEATRPGRRACAHLLVASREEADELRKRLERGADWDALVAQRSLDRETAAKGGSVGEVDDAFVASIARKGGEPELAAAIQDGAPGRIVGPVRTRNGFHLVRCAERTPPQLAPLAEVRDAIARKLQAEAADQALSARLRELRVSAGVRIDEAALRSVPTTPPHHPEL
jgi:parvulin-like peptidyl-prolyl isomerase